MFKAHSSDRAALSLRYNMTFKFKAASSPFFQQKNTYTKHRQSIQYYHSLVLQYDPSAVFQSFPHLHGFFFPFSFSLFEKLKVYFLTNHFCHVFYFIQLVIYAVRVNLGRKRIRLGTVDGTVFSHYIHLIQQSI